MEKFLGIIKKEPELKEEKEETNQSKERGLLNDFQETYQKEIFLILQILKPEGVSMEEYEKETMESLAGDLKKIKVSQRILLEDPETEIREIKELLKSKIKALVEDSYDEKLSKKIDPDSVVKSKIALLNLGDFSDLEKYCKRNRLKIEDLEYQNIAFYFGFYNGRQKKNFTEEELDQLVKVGIGKQLATIKDYHLGETFISVPESLLLEIIKTDISSLWINNIIEKYSSKKKYSQTLFQELIKKGLAFYIFKNIDKFETPNFNLIIDTYNPNYPYNVSEMINNLKKLEQPESLFKENLDYILKHQIVTRDNFNIPEVKDNYKDVLSRINIFESYFDYEKKELIFHPEEDIRKITKDLIKDGYISFLLNISGSKKYLDEIISQDYNWLLDNLRKHNQEHLLLACSAYKQFFKAEDELDYAKKLLHQGKELFLIVGTLPNDHKKIFSNKVFDQEIFDKLFEKGIVIDLKYFKDLNEDSLNKLIGNYLKWQDLSKILEYFKLIPDSRYLSLIKEAEQMVENPGVQSYYLNNFNSELPEKRQEILSLIKEAQTFSEKDEMIIYFVQKYKDDFLSPENEKKRKEFILKYKEGIDNLSQNKSSGDFDETIYRNILKEVYPQRNYDTYQYLEEYEDRTADLEGYSFNRDGYTMKLSGVLGYKLKKEFQQNGSLIESFSSKIKFVKDISKEDKLFDFLEKNIESSEAKSLEGKILEYFKQKGYTVEAMNVLLAYQLLGKYDDFFSNSRDRVSDQKDEISQNYVLLDELANLYGDNMKETIKTIQEKISNNEDKEIFTSLYSNKYQKKYDSVLQIILNDFKKIPEDKITDQVLQKKILKTINNVFQGVNNIKNKAEGFSSLFTVNDLGNFSDVWTRNLNRFLVVDDINQIDSAKIESLQASIFTKIQEEISKYEEIKEKDEIKGEIKLNKERIIKGYLSKNKENAHARMVADICLATDPNMLKNKKYFEFVLFEEERKKCMGTVMLLRMDESKNKKYLLYCPNPAVGLVSEVSAKKLYQVLTDKIIEFAKDNNFDGVLLKNAHGHATNRTGLFQQALEQSCLKDKNGTEMVFNLEKKHCLGGNYTYQKDLQAVWVR